MVTASYTELVTNDNDQLCYSWYITALICDSMMLTLSLCFVASVSVFVLWVDVLIFEAIVSWSWSWGLLSFCLTDSVVDSVQRWKRRLHVTRHCVRWLKASSSSSSRTPQTASCSRPSTDCVSPRHLSLTSSSQLRRLITTLCNQMLSRLSPRTATTSSNSYVKSWGSVQISGGGLDPRPPGVATILSPTLLQ